jgi:hypothetical protein
MQNMFLLRELMDNGSLQEERSQQAFAEVQDSFMAHASDVEQKIGTVQRKVEAMEMDVKRSLQAKFRQIDESIMTLQTRQQQFQNFDEQHFEQQQQLQNLQQHFDNLVIEVQDRAADKERIVVDSVEHESKQERGFSDRNSQHAQLTAVPSEQSGSFRTETDSAEPSALSRHPVTHQHDDSKAREFEHVLEERIDEERLKTQQLREKFEADQAALREEFNKKEAELQKEIEEERKRTAEVCSRLETDHQDVEELVREVEDKYKAKLKKEDKKNLKRVAKLQKKFDKFMESQIEVMANLEAEQLEAAAEKSGALDYEQLERNTRLSNSERTTLFAMLEKNALLSIFDKTGGFTSWNESFLWNKDAEVTAWLGVDINTNGRVSGIQLGSNNLTGSIPTEIAQLQKLDDLRLFGNSLTGCIPPCLGQITNLTTLILNQNNLSGPIPVSLSKCVLLEELDVRSVCAQFMI